MAEMQLRDYKFVIPKLGSLVELNIVRFVSSDPTNSGWNTLVEELIRLASDNASPHEARRVATNVLCKMAAETIAEVNEDDAEERALIQRRALAVLLRLIDGIYARDEELTSTDTDVQSRVVDALKAILEQSGESLVAGWNRTIAIIASVFERTGSPPDWQDKDEAHIDWHQVSRDLVSVQLGKTAFAATQLICSDFLSALPVSVMPSLIELLYRFMHQGDDMNMSLTTITMAWNVSDFLFNNIQSAELDEAAQEASEVENFGSGLEAAAKPSSSVQWLLLLRRMQGVIATGQKEVRKAAFQTICSIFKNHGPQLTAGTWDLTMRSVILRIAAADVALYKSVADGTDDEQKLGTQMDEGISTAVLGGISDIVSQHLGTIGRVAQQSDLWDMFLSRLEAYLDLGRHPVTTAVFSALTKILSSLETRSRTWAGPVDRILALWLEHSPAASLSDGTESNEEALTAYVDSGAELYRLTQQSLDTSQTDTLVENIYLSVKLADGPGYQADVNRLSPVQGKALRLLKQVQTETPSILLVIAAKTVTLSHKTGPESSSQERPTLVAVASEAIDWLQSLVSRHCTDDDIWISGAVVTAVQSLRKLIEMKYTLKPEPKELPLWRKATEASLALCKPILDRCDPAQDDKNIKASIWEEYVLVARGIMSAEGLELVEDVYKIYNDQLADIDSFRKLREMLIPRLGDPELPDEVRSIYARSLFDASIVHQTETGEIPEYDSSSLFDLGKIRRGRVKRIPYSQRERMCYECFSELIALASKSDGSTLTKKLAQAAVPLLILRLAIPIRVYIADQPLCGYRPQPLSELEELLFCFDTMKTLELEPDALAIDSVADGRTGEKAHLHYLYPLLAKAVSTAGDRWSGSDEVLTPLQAVLESVTPVP